MSEESEGSPSAGTDGEDDPWPDGWESATDRTVDEGATADSGASEGVAPTAREPEPELDDAADEEEYEPSIAGVFGAQPEDAPPRPEIVPETPSLENVFFVLVGVLFGLFVLYRAATVFAG